MQRTLDFVDGRGIVDGRGGGYTTPDGRVIPTVFPEFVNEQGAVKTFRQQSARFLMPRVGLAYRSEREDRYSLGVGWFDNLDHQNTWTILNLMPPKVRQPAVQLGRPPTPRPVTVTGADGNAYSIPTRMFTPGHGRFLRLTTRSSPTLAA